MRTIFLYCCFALILVSCKTNEPEVVNLEDIAAQSKDGDKTPNSDSSAVKEVPAITQLDVEELLKNSISLNQSKNVDTLLFLDRFSAKSALKFNYFIENDSVFYAKYNFKDSMKTKNAFFNWMNCFDARCKSIVPGENKNLQKTGFLLLQNDTSIIYISTGSQKELSNWKKHFTELKDVKWNYILNQRNSGKVTWETYSAEELKPFIQN